MSEDPGPLTRRLLASARLVVPPCPLRMTARVQHTPSPLYGRRGVFRPGVALRTIQRLGNARHALAQRTVSGLMEIHAPFAPEPKKKADGKDAGRRPGAPPSGPTR